jgi:hypothetical protein
MRMLPYITLAAICFLGTACKSDPVLSARCPMPIAVEPNSFQLAAGGEQSYIARRVCFQAGAFRVEWSIADTTIASVSAVNDSSALVRALRPGATTISILVPPSFRYTSIVSVTAQ